MTTFENNIPASFDCIDWLLKQYSQKEWNKTDYLFLKMFAMLKKNISRICFECKLFLWQEIATADAGSNKQDICLQIGEKKWN